MRGFLGGFGAGLDCGLDLGGVLGRKSVRTAKGVRGYSASALVHFDDLSFTNVHGCKRV